MILAAPLVIPFAEAVGLSVATLGMAKVADMVNEYIQENPEQSMKILSTIVPGVGIGEIFMKKGKDEEVEEDIEVEDVDARDLTKKEKAKKMKEIVKEGGNLKETMKKGYEEIILPGKEDEMLDEAEDRYEGGVEEVSKPKFDYTKFFRKRRADGGSIGIEVLFEEKKPRKNFFMGGPALEGQALSIYNSMNAYGFSDQEIANALEGQGLYTPGGSTPDAPDQGIINQQLNQSGGDGPKGDFGIFGNLLKDTAKDFNVQVYDEELGDFIDTKITGYKNVNSGLYQDKFGKNLQPAFSNKGQVFGLAGIVAQALGLTPDTVGGYVPGSIKGKYDGITDMFGSIKNFNLKNPFNFFKKQQATIADINAANLKAKQELDAKLAAEAAAAALQQQMQDTGVTGSNYNQAANIAGGGGGNTATYGGQTAREATYDNDPSTGTSQGYSQHYARGGLATMFKEKR
jgi:hypothetical protein